jgi:hypothetical protein
MKVKLLRAMCFGGQRSEADTVLDVSDLLARELLAQGRAEAVAPATTKPGPMTTQTAAAVVKGKASKGQEHVPE